MESVIKVQVLDKAIYISLPTQDWERHKPISAPLATGK